MYRSIETRTSPPPPPPPGNPLSIWTFQFSCGQIPHPRAKKPVQMPHVKAEFSGQMPHLRSTLPPKVGCYLGWKSVSSVFPDVTNRNVMSATLNIGSPMITGGSGSFFSIWRKTRCFYAQCGTKHKFEATNQIPHPSGVVVKCLTQSTLRSVKCPGCGGGGGGGDVSASFELIGTLYAIGIAQWVVNQWILMRLTFKN